jgi:hypothetical protein
MKQHRSLGDQVLDHYVDLAPYQHNEPHIALAVSGLASTSVGISFGNRPILLLELLLKIRFRDKTQ